MTTAPRRPLAAAAAALLAAAALFAAAALLSRSPAPTPPPLLLAAASRLRGPAATGGARVAMGFRGARGRVRGAMAPPRAGGYGQQARGVAGAA
eukprot:CAMPEP_0167802204 /NCGR_PEP_ID=MMETSP0111_2-20121227/18973_1 /TAXON_ID=91324 /ORGANISM="Lotharella globosa, Strain CCCM811" /LENGTH=93 /DNA_ID=CAMNT_0007698181 /DNA_START=11 /DNA_END=288 /DNA_ORIENTATION=-